MTTPPDIRILGEISVDVDGDSVALDGKRAIRRLLVAAALFRGRPVPERDVPRSWIVGSTRKRLVRMLGPKCLVFDQGTLRLSNDVPVDYHDIRRRMDSLQADLPSSGNVTRARLQRLLDGAAKELAPGLEHLVDEDNDQWFAEHRAAYHRDVHRLFEAAVDWAARRQEHDLVDRWLRQLEDFDPPLGWQLRDAQRGQAEEAGGGRVGPREPVFEIVGVEIAQLGEFVGRGHDLDRLDRAMMERSGGIHVLHAPPGMGKTRLAVEFAHRHCGSPYLVTWVVNAENAAFLRESLMTLARRAGLDPERTVPHQNEQERMSVVFEWLDRQENRPWLIVLDNAEPSVVRDVFRRDPALGQVLVTSTYPDWLGIADASALRPLSIQAAKELVAAFTRFDAETSGLADLCEELERLPLALRQAASTMEADRLNPVQYLERFNSAEIRSLLQEWPTASPQERTVAATFTVAIERAAQPRGRRPGGRPTHPGARTVAELAAQLAGEPIPAELVATAGAQIPELRRPQDRERAVAALRAFSLLTSFDEDTRAFSVHRLVQRVVSASMPEHSVEERLRALLQAMLALVPSFPLEGEEQRRVAPLAAHLEKLTNAALANHRLRADAVELLSRHGVYLTGVGEFQAAEAAHREAVRVSEEVGTPLPTLARRRLLLGEVLIRRGRFTEGDRLVAEVVDVLREAPADLQEDLVWALTVLGGRKRHQGHPGEACRLLHEAADLLDRPGHGAAPRQVLRTLGHLVDALRLHGGVAELDDAERHARRCLDILQVPHPESEFPDEVLDRVDIAAARHYRALGIVLRESGRLQLAKVAQERALRICERTVPPDHYEFHGPLDSLTRVMYELGDFERALEIAVRARQVASRTFGTDYDNVASAKVHQALALRALGRDSDARQLLEEAAETYLRTHGDPARPNRLVTLDQAWAQFHLAVALGSDGEVDRAARLLRRVRAFRVTRQGAAHQHVASCDFALADLAARRGDVPHAIAQHRKALEARRRAFGTSVHPRVAESLERLGDLHAAASEAVSARAAYRECLQIRVESHGPDNPLTRRVSGKLESLGLLS